VAALRTQATGQGTTGGVTAQLTGVLSGDLLTLCFYERDGNSITSVSDDLNGAWTQAVVRATTAARSGIYFFKNSAAGNPTVTLTISGTSPRDFNFAAWSGMVTTGGADTTNNAGNSSVTSHTHGSVTPSASALILTALGIGADHGGNTLNAGFTALNIDASAATNKQIYGYKLAHTGAVNPTHTTVNSVSSDGVVATFLESAASASARRLTILGVG